MYKDILFFCGLFFLLNLNAQSDWSSKYIDVDKSYSDITEKEKIMINEVFGDKAKTEVWNNPKFKFALIKLLRERITFIEAKSLKKQKPTFTLKEKGLSTDYNKDLKIDTIFDKQTFNPLKYNLDFFSKGTYLYKIEGTDFYLEVESQYRKKI